MGLNLEILDTGRWLRSRGGIGRRTEIQRGMGVPLEFRFGCSLYAEGRHLQVRVLPGSLLKFGETNGSF